MAPPRQGKELEEEDGTAAAAAAALRAPADVMARVFSQLDCVDLLSCSLVCKQWYHDSAELREEWRKEYLDAWEPVRTVCNTSGTIRVSHLLNQKFAKFLPLTLLLSSFAQLPL
ncbi:hypothetical protein PR202_ga16045 [Eleusine coracana subsp. coracana]|uniref:F-box domain-containing protein n=1 Tax=Eleusine coracana subsp. coracana TaxID=191504 RepID=A0AAV5CLG2_ELECO|nr:hypothetical protein PR202_ga16045 [Eleusine coracana subsp. coracana]